MVKTGFGRTPVKERRQRTMEEDEPLSSSAGPCTGLGARPVDTSSGPRNTLQSDIRYARRWSNGVRGPGRAVTGGVLGCAQCLRGRGEGAAASRPALQGFRRARRQRVGARAEEAGWYACRARVVGIGVRTAAARSLVLSLSLSQGRTAPSGASSYRPKTAPRREVRAQDHLHT